MQLFQIEGILEEARMAREAGHGGLIAPHNWGREYPFYVMIHMGYAIPNYYGAEHDPGVQMDPILHHDGYTIKDGRCHAPASPGFGVSLDLKKLERREKIFDFKA